MNQEVCYPESPRAGSLLLHGIATCMGTRSVVFFRENECLFPESIVLCVRTVRYSISFCTLLSLILYSTYSTK
jgi:hypothetical protein